MSKNVAEAITLVALMALTVLASLDATQPTPSTSLRVSPQPIHSTHPMIPAPVPPSPQISSAQKASEGCSLPTAQCWASYNWAGYAVTGPTSSVTDVKGSWTVPAVVPGLRNNKCLDTQVTWFDASFWIGIDGFSSNTVEQTGTSSDCYYGQVYNYAWYEFYPAESVTIQSLTPNPGDRITAEVKYSSGAFTTTITDLTTKQTFTSPATAVPGAKENSGEWIAESAFASQGILALTDFISVTFSDGYATVSGLSQPITAFGSNLQWIEMVNYNWPTTPGVKGSPSALTMGGKRCMPVQCQESFNVKWLSSGP